MNDRAGEAIRDLIAQEEREIERRQAVVDGLKRALGAVNKVGGPSTRPMVRKTPAGPRPTSEYEGLSHAGRVMALAREHDGPFQISWIGDRFEDLGFDRRRAGNAVSRLSQSGRLVKMERRGWYCLPGDEERPPVDDQGGRESDEGAKS